MFPAEIPTFAKVILTMLDFFPYLKDKSIAIRISTLVLIIAISLVLLMVIGILLAVPFFGTGFLSGFNAMNDFNDSTTIAFLKYFQIINQIGVFILPALLYGYLENRNAGRYLNIDQKPGIFLLFISILLIIAFIPAVNAMAWLNEQMKLPTFMKGIEDWMRESEDKANLLTEAFLNVNTLSGLIINLFIIGFLAALGEEFLFRGVVIRLLSDGLKNTHLAVILSAILFSAFHMQFFGFIPRTALGILFGYIYVWSGSLWIPIILHFIFNGTTVAVAYLYQNGFISTDIESFGVSDNIYIISASFVFTFLFLWIIYRNRRVAFSHAP
jgi:membrane protease YdiL (CAAX protease family)